MSGLICDICGAPSIGVAASAMCPISHAYCEECIDLNREPWGTLVGGLIGCTKDTVADWARPYIEGTCTFYNKTEDDLWAEIAAAEKEMYREPVADDGGPIGDNECYEDGEL